MPTLDELKAERDRLREEWRKAERAADRERNRVSREIRSRHGVGDAYARYEAADVAFDQALAASSPPLPDGWTWDEHMTAREDFSAVWPDGDELVFESDEGAEMRAPIAVVEAVLRLAKAATP